MTGAATETVATALARGRAVLQAGGIETPALDARLLLAHAASLSREQVLLQPHRRIDPAPYDAALRRRLAREPVALIQGWQEFWSLRLRVSAATLVPRADSETLIEAALAARPRGVGSVLDLGTGTGCLLLAALAEYPAAWGVGVDRSQAAAALARANAATLGFAERAAIVCANWADPIAGRFDLVLSNPPYIETAALPDLMPEVGGYEPASALDGGADGLDAYRVLLARLPALLRPGGLGILELGAGQGAAVAHLAHAAGLRVPGVRADLAGIGRALLVEAA